MYITDAIRRYLGWCPETRSFNESGYRDAAGYNVPLSGVSERPRSPGLFRNSSDEKYRHTQTGIVFIAALVVGILGCLLEIFGNDRSGIPALALVVLLLVTAVLLTSTTLTVVLSDKVMTVYQGPLALRKRTIPLSEIASVRVEEDPLHRVRGAVWYFNPGAKLALRIGPGVLIGQRGGKTFWIGSDEPELLVRTIISLQGGSNVHL